jgi:hypothetical protein
MTYTKEDIMFNRTKIRTWDTPLNIGAFALSAISGVMIFFHVNSVFVKVIHEWGSWFLVIGGLLHVACSWQSFVRYFSRPAAKAIMTGFAILIIMFFIPMGESTEKQGRKLPPTFLSRALPEASFSAVAGIARHDPDELMKEFESKGVAVKDGEESIRDIATNNNKEYVEILNMIF